MYRRHLIALTRQCFDPYHTYTHTHRLLGSNALSGTLPTSIGFLVNLQTLYVGPRSPACALSPSPIHRRVSLKLLAPLTHSINDRDLDSNQLSGTLPSSLGNCVSLATLYDGCQSSKQSSLLAQSHAISLSLVFNLCIVISCAHRDLSYNRFSGPIPDSAISNLANLAYLYDSLATPLVLAHF